MKVTHLLPMLAAAAALSACGKLTMENYGKLKVGQSYADVTAIIGEPARCDEALGMRKCEWGDERKGVGAIFAADKAIEFHANNLK